MSKIIFRTIKKRIIFYLLSSLMFAILLVFICETYSLSSSLENQKYKIATSRSSFIYEVTDYINDTDFFNNNICYLDGSNMLDDIKYNDAYVYTYLTYLNYNTIDYFGISMENGVDDGFYAIFPQDKLETLEISIGDNIIININNNEIETKIVGSYVNHQGGIILSKHFINYSINNKIKIVMNETNQQEVLNYLNKNEQSKILEPSELKKIVSFVDLGCSICIYIFLVEMLLLVFVWGKYIESFIYRERDNLLMLNFYGLNKKSINIACNMTLLIITAITVTFSIILGFLLEIIFNNTLFIIFKINLNIGIYILAFLGLLIVNLFVIFAKMRTFYKEWEVK